MSKIVLLEAESNWVKVTACCGGRVDSRFVVSHPFTGVRLGLAILTVLRNSDWPYKLEGSLESIVGKFSKNIVHDEVGHRWLNAAEVKEGLEEEESRKLFHSFEQFLNGGIEFLWLEDLLFPDNERAAKMFDSKIDQVVKMLNTLEGL